MKLRDPGAGWGLLLILLHIRRRTRDLGQTIAAGTPASAFWKHEWFPKTGISFRMACAQKDTSGSIEIVESGFVGYVWLHQGYRGWGAASLAATFEFQTLSINEIRGILHQTFVASAFAEKTQVIKGCRLRGEGEALIREPYSRVGMVKARAEDEQKERRAKRRT